MEGTIDQRQSQCQQQKRISFSTISSVDSLSRSMFSSAQHTSASVCLSGPIVNNINSTRILRQLETQSSSLAAMLDQQATSSTPPSLNLYRISFDPHPHQAATATSNRGQERSSKHHDIQDGPTFTSGSSTIISKNKHRMKRAVQWTVGCFIEEDEIRLTTSPSTNYCCTKSQHEIRFEWMTAPALANCNSKCDFLLRIDGIVAQESAVLYDDILGLCLNHSTTSKHKSRNSQSQKKLKLVIDFSMADHPRIPVQLRVTCHALFHTPKDHDETSITKQQESSSLFCLRFGGSPSNIISPHRQYQQPHQKLVSFGDLPQLKDVTAGTHLKRTTSMVAPVIGSNISSNALSAAFLAEQQAGRQPAEPSKDLHNNYKAQRQSNRSTGENKKKATASPLLKRVTILKSTRRINSSQRNLGQDVCIFTEPSEPSVDLPHGGSSNHLVRMPSSTSVASPAAMPSGSYSSRRATTPSNERGLESDALSKATKNKSKCRSSPPSCSRDLDDDSSLTDDASAVAPVVVHILAKEKGSKATQQRARAMLDKHIAERGSNTELRRSKSTNSSNANNSMDVPSHLPLCASFNTQAQVKGCGGGCDNKTRWVTTSRSKSRSLKRRTSQNDSKEQDRNAVFTASAFTDIIQMTSPSDVHFAGSPAHHHNLKGNYKQGERETKEKEGRHAVSTGVAEKLEEDRLGLQKRCERGNSAAGQSQEESSQEISNHTRAYHQSVFCLQYSSSDSSSGG
jgi:hypothetical protein